ncbi:MAG TPA: (2Fe-2S)-binding protein [Pseudolabrys sp.]|nr:(2Fe-2S)-binding protein [Pseudolabrys sp.]
MIEITLTVNGITKRLKVEPRRLLADVLRHEFGCYGVHFGCSHGACGCCTVHVAGEARLSCLAFACQCDGMEIVTIEGVSKSGGLHPLQQAFIDEHGLQCGYCTPGFIMALTRFVDRSEAPTDAEIREAMSGNICRCTGYHSIVAAVRRAIAARQER